MPTAPLAPLWPHQIRAVSFLRDRRDCGGVFGEVGTGKTRIGVVVAKADPRVIVLTPISSLGVWADEIAALRLHTPVLRLDRGSSADKAARVAAFADGWIIVNYESFWRPVLLAALKAWAPTFVIADEVQRVRHHTTRQAKNASLLRLWPSVRGALGLSGTPATKGREGLFGIFRFIDPNVFGTRWRAFANQYLIEVNRGDYNEIIGYRNTDEMDRKLHKAAVQIPKSEALPWLPPERDQFVDVVLSPESRKRYTAFARESVAQITGRDPTTGEVVSGQALARIALSTLVRLQQLTSGFIGTDAGEIAVSDEKLTSCVDRVQQIRDSDRSVVIFYHFNYDYKALTVALAKARKEPIGVLRGGITPAEQQQALDLFYERKTRILLCQIHKAIGVNKMVAASDAIFYSVGYSLEDFVQAKGRIHRPGQTEPVTYHHLVVKRSVDEKVYEALQKNMDIAREFLRLDYARGFLVDAPET